MSEDDFSALAGEYVLGLLEGEELARAEALRLADPAFVAAVQAWELRLLPLTEEVPEVAPPQRLWKQIAARTNPPVYSGRRRFGFSLALATAFVVLLVFYLRPETGRPVGGFSTTYGLIEVDANAADIIVHPQNFAAPDGKSVELWLIIGNHAPQPMGLASTFARFTMKRPPAGAQVVVAASLEPAGGSPTGLPTGPVIGEVSLTNL
jgi:anti-sigma-K factor RskA